MDSYHAPYKAKHHYWPGLLLVLRFSLLLVFALNHQQDPSINLLAILVGAGIPHLWSWVSGGLYRSWCLDALEGSFMLNHSCCCNLPCQTFKRKSAGSWVHLHVHSTCHIHYNPYLPHLPASEAHQAVEEGA